MRIGFDVSQTGTSKAGCGYFADSLIRHLAIEDTENDYVLYPSFGDNYWDPDWPSAVCRIGRSNFRQGLGHHKPEEAQRFWRQPPDDFEAQLGNPDVIHANNFFCPRGLKKARIVYTLYDLSFLEWPEWTSEENRVACFDGAFNASLYADRIIAISECSRRHFLEMFPHFPADRTRVVYPASRFPGGVDDQTAPKSPAPLTPHEFWLHVGTREPRKNQQRLLAAYARLQSREVRTFPLVTVGGSGWLMDGLERTLSDLNLEGSVVNLGYVDDGTLRWLYRNCFAFVYPSLFEGFGLPVLEAMSLGAPVIASNTSSLPEVVGDAGLLVDPLEPDQILEAMLRLARDPGAREELAKKAVERAGAFSWNHAAQATLEIYRELGG